MPAFLSHIAIGSPRISEAIKKFEVLGLKVESTHPVPTEKVNAAMVPVPVSKHFRIELLEPMGEGSPISKFLDKKPAGGIHHLCFEVDHIENWESVLKKEGFEVLPPGIRKGARGKVLFVHPKSFSGVLVELEEIA